MTRHETGTWRGVRTEILRRINEREWRPGDAVPNEVDLATELGCARGTVNRAMRELAEDGILIRRRKAGTRVALNRIQKATLEIPIAREEVEGRGAAYAYRLLLKELAAIPANVAERLGVAPGQTLMHIKTLHTADNRPFVYEDRWVDTRTVPRVRDMDFSTYSVNEWLVQNVPLTKGEIAFLAASASPEEAKVLEIADGTAVFVVERATRNLKGPITAARLVYAPGYVMNTTI